MNTVEIEQAISELAQAPYDRAEFPYLFLASFGEKATTLKRLRTGNSNKSDVAGGILQRNNIHIATCDEGAVGDTLKALKASPETAKQKAKLILATDGHVLRQKTLSLVRRLPVIMLTLPIILGSFCRLPASARFVRSATTRLIFRPPAA